MDETEASGAAEVLASLPPTDELVEAEVAPGVVAISGGRLSLGASWGSEWAVDQGWFSSAMAVLYSMSNADILAAVSRQGGLVEAVAAEMGGSQQDYSRGGRLYKVYDGVAHIPLVGAMTKRPSCMSSMFGSGASTLQFRQAHHAANQDPSVQSRLNVIDSPGGEVSGVFDASNDMFKGKPVDSFFEDMAASAALLAGIGGRQNWANVNAAVGSVGVYTKLVQSKASDSRQVYLVKAGKNKAIGEEGQDITPEQLATVQSRVDTLHSLFLRQISRGRGDKVSAKQLASIADADVYIGKQAVKVGLVDHIGDIDAAHKAAVKANNESRRKVMSVPDAQLRDMLNPDSAAAAPPETVATIAPEDRTPPAGGSAVTQAATNSPLQAALAAAGVVDVAAFERMRGEAELGRAAALAARDRATKLAVAVYGTATPEAMAAVAAAETFIREAPYAVVQASIVQYEATLQASGNAAPQGSRQARRVTAPSDDAVAIGADVDVAAAYVGKTYPARNGAKNGGTN